MEAEGFVYMWGKERNLVRDDTNVPCSTTQGGYNATQSNYIIRCFRPSTTTFTTILNDFTAKSL